MTEYTIGVKEDTGFYDVKCEMFYTIEEATKEACKYIKDKKEIIIFKDEYLSENSKRRLIANDKTGWKFLEFNKKYI